LLVQPASGRATTFTEKKDGHGGMMGGRDQEIKKLARPYLNQQAGLGGAHLSS
jgi:hypothetical protein